MSCVGKQNKTKQTLEMLIAVFDCLKTASCNILTCTSMFAHGSNWMSGFPRCKVLVNHKMYKILNRGEIVEQAAVPSSTTDPSQALIFIIYLHHLPAYISLKVKLQQIKYSRSYPQGIVSHYLFYRFQSAFTELVCLE